MGACRGWGWGCWLGGQCTALYPEKPIYDIPGHPGILAGQLIEKLEQQAAPFKPVYHTGEQVVSLSDNIGLWQIKTSKNTVNEAKAIINWVNVNEDIREFSLKYGELELFISRNPQSSAAPAAANRRCPPP